MALGQLQTAVTLIDKSRSLQQGSPVAHGISSMYLNRLPAECRERWKRGDSVVTVCLRLTGWQLLEMGRNYDADSSEVSV